MTGRPRRVIWAYDLEHLLHPFIGLGLGALVEAGWDVTVVAEDKAEGAPYRSFDDFSYAARERHYHELIVVARGQVEQAALGCDRRRQALQDQLDLPGAARPRGLRRLELRGAIVVLKAMAAAAMAWRAALWGLGRLRHFTYERWLIYLRGFWRLARLDADVMVASRPEAAILAWVVAKARGMRFVYYPFELYGEQISKPSWLVAALERLMLRHGVDAVITQNAFRAAVLRDERHARVEPVIVHNYKRFAPPGRVRGGRMRAALGIGADTRIVLYEGMIVGSRWLEFLAQAVLHLPDDVVVVMMGQEKLKWRKLYRKHLKAPLATGRLIIAPPVPHDELPDYVADADVGVIIYDDSVRNNLFCEPGKLSDYIAVGVPVVAPNFPTIGPVVRERGLGLCFDGHSPEAIAAALLQVLDRPKAQWRPALDRAAAQLTWESQVPKLLSAVSGDPLRD